MVKKMKLIPWPWPSCSQTRTLSFRANRNDDIFKTINSAYPGTSIIDVEETNADTFIIKNSGESFSPTTMEDNEGYQIETVIRGLSSERLFFEPGGTSSIMDETTKDDMSFPLIKESEVLSMDSKDPYFDFRKSMEEMVEAHDLKDWKVLEELLSWYLRVNGKHNHKYIIGAYVDLLVGLSTSLEANNSSSCSCNSPNSSFLSFCKTCSSSSSFSTSNSPCVSSFEILEEIESSATPCLSSLMEDIDEEDDEGIGN